MRKVEQVQMAERLLVEGRSAEALKLVEAVLANAPGDIRALRLAARAAARLRAFEGAAGFWLKAAEARAGDDPQSLSNAATCWLRARNFRAALDTADRTLALDPADVGAIEVKMAASEALRLVPELVDAALRLAAIDPQQAMTSVPRVLAAGDPLGAAEIVCRVGSVAQKTPAVTQAVISALEDVSKRAYRAGDEMSAARHLRTMLRLSPDHEPARRVLAQLIGPRLTAARQKLADGDLVAARNGLEGVLALAPDHTDALRALAGVAAREGAPQEAIELVERLTAAAPDDPTLQFALAQAYEADRRFAKAVDATLRARSLGYSAERCERALHRLLRIMRDTARELQETKPDESLDLVEAILKAEPANVAAQRLAKTLARHFLLELRAALQSEDRARQYRAATLLDRADPDNASALKVMAKVSEALGRHSDAAQALTRLLRVEGETEQTLVRLARSHKATRQFTEAVEAADRALAINPASVSALAIRTRVLATPSFQRERRSAPGA